MISREKMPKKNFGEKLVKLNKTREIEFLDKNLTFRIVCEAVQVYNNESFPSDTVCFDNCPNYLFPNVFTPNQDNNNDFFQALMPIKFINSIELNILNRWGQVVFNSSNPEFKWDGIHQETQLECPSGTYYFECLVSSIRLFGFEEIVLNGYLQLIRDVNTNNQ